MEKGFNKYDKREIINYINLEISKSPSKEKLKKLKTLAMSRNIKIGALRKRFCKKCYTLFNSENSEIRINQRFKKTKCKTCGYIMRYKIK